MKTQMQQAVENPLIVGSRVAIGGHDFYNGTLGVIYHLKQDGISTVASVCLDWGIDAFEITTDHLEHHDSVPDCNLAWDDIHQHPDTKKAAQ
jgi:hypothetical protein